MEIAVYCSASETIRSLFLEDAAELGTAIAKQGHDLIFGGGNIGSMGRLGRAVHESQGRGVSVIPKFFDDQGLTLAESDEIILTDDMQKRRKIMWERCSGALVLPGGLGTLEEAVEFLVLNQLSLIDRPLVFANVDGYWNPFFEMIEHMLTEKMLTDEHSRIFDQANSGVGALNRLESLIKKDMSPR